MPNKISLTRARRCRREQFPVVVLGEHIAHKRLGPVVVVAVTPPEYVSAEMAEDFGNPQHGGCWVQEYVVERVSAEVSHA